MKLIVGLGNPGKDYVHTRHNVGFLIIDNYVKSNNWQKNKDYLFYTEIINGEKVIFLKPQTYMNLSGKAVLDIVTYYKLSMDDILVIHDDLDLAIGKFKLKINSSSGGHNGIKDIIEKLGNNKFARLKIGIGKDKKVDIKNYVLNNLSTEELTKINDQVYIDIINSFIVDGIDKTMNRYN